LEVSDDEDDEDEYHGDRWVRLWRWVYQHIGEMYTNCYEMPHAGIPRGPSHMHHVLFTLKSTHPD
jgi:hypothetical protein